MAETAAGNVERMIELLERIARAVEAMDRRLALADLEADSPAPAAPGPPGTFAAVCDQCGQETLVPFKPNKNKPILCNSCFRARSRGR